MRFEAMEKLRVLYDSSTLTALWSILWRFQRFAPKTTDSDKLALEIPGKQCSIDCCMLPCSVSHLSTKLLNAFLAWYPLDLHKKMKTRRKVQTFPTRPPIVPNGFLKDFVTKMMISMFLRTFTTHPSRLYFLTQPHGKALKVLLRACRNL